MEDLTIKEEFTSSTIICRLCLVQNSTYHEAFDKNSVGLNIADVITRLSGISISPLDNWPKSVCSTCVEKISEFNTLILKAKDNEARLVEIFGEYHVQEDKVLNITLETRKSPIFVSTDLKQDFKDETVYDLIKEEEFSYTSDVDVKEEARPKPDRPKRNTRSTRKRRKTQVKGTPLKHDDKAPKEKDKNPEDEKRDTEIHDFFKMECVLCEGISYPRFSELQKHFRAQHKCRGYVVCCGKKLKAPLYMQMHMQEHINPVKYQCQICLKYYKTTETLAKHKILIHTPVELREFACDKCPQRFAVAGALKAHLINHTAPEDRQHVCQTCGRAFVTIHVLIEHVRRKHENAKNFVCEICAKVYRTKCLFEKHMAEHSNHQLKPTIPCPICGKMFKHRVAMRNHKRCHDTSGNLQCDYCPMVSVNRRALYEHVRSNHKKPQTCQCSICDRVFKMKRSLKEHMASHTGEVLYTCPYCAKEFNNNGNYFQHRKNFHPVEFLAEQEKRRAGQVYQKPNLKNK